MTVVVETEVVVEIDVVVDHFVVTVVDHFVIVTGGIGVAVSSGRVQIRPLGNISVVEATVQEAHGGDVGGLLGMLIHVRSVFFHDSVVRPFGPTVVPATVALG